MTWFQIILSAEELAQGIGLQLLQDFRECREKADKATHLLLLSHRPVAEGPITFYLSPSIEFYGLHHFVTQYKAERARLANPGTLGCAVQVGETSDCEFWFER